MAEQSIDAKTREISEKVTKPGKELQSYQEAEKQLLAIRSAQQQNLNAAKINIGAQARQNQVIANAGNLVAASQPQSQQVAVNPATQATLKKFGGKPTVQKQVTHSQQVTRQNIVNNYNTTTTTTNNIQQPPQLPPSVYKNQGGDNTGKFKIWLNNTIAQQNAENDRREREYSKKESTLTRDANKMLRKLGELGKDMTERLDPRKLGTSVGSQLKTLLFMFGFQFLASNWKNILGTVARIEKKIKSGIEYFGYKFSNTTGEGKFNFSESQFVADMKGIFTGDFYNVKNGKKIQRGQGGMLETIRTIFVGDGKSVKGIVDIFGDYLKRVGEEKNKAASYVKFPTLSLDNITGSIQSLGEYLGTMFSIYFGNTENALKTHVGYQIRRETGLRSLARSASNGELDKMYADVEVSNSFGRNMEGKDGTTTANLGVRAYFLEKGKRSTGMSNYALNSEGRLNNSVEASIAQAAAITGRWDAVKSGANFNPDEIAAGYENLHTYAQNRGYAPVPKYFINEYSQLSPEEIKRLKDSGDIVEKRYVYVIRPVNEDIDKENVGVGALKGYFGGQLASRTTINHYLPLIGGITDTVLGGIGMGVGAGKAWLHNEFTNDYRLDLVPEDELTPSDVVAYGQIGGVHDKLTESVYEISPFAIQTMVNHVKGPNEQGQYVDLPIDLQNKEYYDSIREGALRQVGGNLGGNGRTWTKNELRDAGVLSKRMQHMLYATASGGSNVFWDNHADEEDRVSGKDIYEELIREYNRKYDDLDRDLMTRSEGDIRDFTLGYFENRRAADGHYMNVHHTIGFDKDDFISSLSNNDAADFKDIAKESTINWEDIENFSSGNLLGSGSDFAINESNILQLEKGELDLGTNEMSARLGMITSNGKMISFKDYLRADAGFRNHFKNILKNILYDYGVFNRYNKHALEKNCTVNEYISNTPEVRAEYSRILNSSSVEEVLSFFYEYYYPEEPKKFASREERAAYINTQEKFYQSRKAIIALFNQRDIVVDELYRCFIASRRESLLSLVKSELKEGRLKALAGLNQNIELETEKAALMSDEFKNGIIYGMSMADHKQDDYTRRYYNQIDEYNNVVEESNKQLGNDLSTNPATAWIPEFFEWAGNAAGKITDSLSFGAGDLGEKDYEEISNIRGEDKMMEGISKMTRLAISLGLKMIDYAEKSLRMFPEGSPLRNANNVICQALRVPAIIPQGKSGRFGADRSEIGAEEDKEHPFNRYHEGQDISWYLDSEGKKVHAAEGVTPVYAPWDGYLSKVISQENYAPKKKTKTKTDGSTQEYEEWAYAGRQVHVISSDSKLDFYVCHLSSVSMIAKGAETDEKGYFSQDSAIKSGGARCLRDKDKIRKGTLLGYMGGSGRNGDGTYDAHFHFSIYQYRGGKKVEGPLDWLRRHKRQAIMGAMDPLLVEVKADSSDILNGNKYIDTSKVRFEGGTSVVINEDEAGFALVEGDGTPAGNAGDGGSASVNNSTDDDEEKSDGGSLFQKIMDYVKETLTSFGLNSTVDSIKNKVNGEIEGLKKLKENWDNSAEIKSPSFKASNHTYSGPIYPEFVNYEYYKKNPGEIPPGLDERHWREAVFDMTGREPQDLTSLVELRGLSTNSRLILSKYAKNGGDSGSNTAVKDASAENTGSTNAEINQQAESLSEANSDREETTQVEVKDALTGKTITVDSKTAKANEILNAVLHKNTDVEAKIPIETIVTDLGNGLFQYLEVIKREVELTAMGVGGLNRTNEAIAQHSAQTAQATGFTAVNLQGSFGPKSQPEADQTNNN